MHTFNVEKLNCEAESENRIWNSLIGNVSSIHHDSSISIIILVVLEYVLASFLLNTDTTIKMQTVHTFTPG